MKWDTIQLGDVMNVKHGYPFDSEFFTDEGKYILLSPGSCHERGGLKLKGDKEKYFTGPIPETYVLREGDMLVVMTDLINTAPILGGAFIVPEDNRFLHNQRLGLVQITDSQRIDTKFLYFLLQSHDYRGQVRGSASGATVRHTSPGRIKACKVRVPHDRRAQERIGEILGDYDTLAENNRRRMELLEDTARQLYAEWLVRLRYPGHARTRRTDSLPKGWTRRPLGDVCAEVRDTAVPDDCEPDLPYIGLEHIPRRSIALREWGRAEEVTSNKHRFRAGDILFGKIRPYFHKVGVAFVGGVASSDAIVLRPTAAEWHSLALLTVSSDAFVADASKTAREGSKMPRADWKLMKTRPVAVPPAALLRAFNEQIEPIVAQLKTLTFQTQKLRTARDLLLPRLMRGELTV